MSEIPANDCTQLEKAVWAVLGGTSVAEAARRIDTSPGDLAAAIERYRGAGRAALEITAVGWHQVDIHFTDYGSAQRTFRTYFLRALTTSPVGCWWFLRKHPDWRLRAHPTPNATTTDVAAHLDRALQSALSWGVIESWQSVIYEPETAAFGGPDGMSLTHRFFHADSVGVLDYLGRLDSGTAHLPEAKTTSLLTMTAMLRGAGLELGEQGDVWSKVEQLRPSATGGDPNELALLTQQTRQLLLADTKSLLANGGTLADLEPWHTAMNHSGQTLAEAAQAGRLTSGLRSVAARSILFHWNRMGFPADRQATMASAARQAALEFGTLQATSAVPRRTEQE